RQGIHASMTSNPAFISRTHALAGSCFNPLGRRRDRRGILSRMPTAKVNHPNRAPGTAIAIMAAGKGTRLKSKHPKVLHEVGGKPLLSHVIAAAINVVPAQDVCAIIGHEEEHVLTRVSHSGMTL